MLFALFCTDKPGAEPVRLANRDDHVAYLKQSPVVFAGPTLDESGAHMTGSLVVLDLPDRAAADAWAANDPYAKADLFERVEIRPWKKVIG